MNHAFDVDIAVKYGVPEAILIENFRFWIAKNKANGRHFHEGRYWTYNSSKAMTELFPYWSQDQIKRTLKRLEDAGVLLSGNFNSNPYDRTKWYSLSDAIDCAKSHNGKDESAQSTNQTDINTDINTDTSLSSDKSDDDAGVPVLLAEKPKPDKKPKPPAAAQPAIDGVPDALLADWLAVRKAKRAGPLTATAIAGLQREAAAAGMTPAQAVTHCCECGWVGFRADWVANQRTVNAPAGRGQIGRKQAQSFAEKDYGQGIQVL